MRFNVQYNEILSLLSSAIAIHRQKETEETSSNKYKNQKVKK